MSILTRTTMDHFKCETPGCTSDHSVLYLNPRCCQAGAATVRYFRDDGVLVLECPKCETAYAAIKVAGS
jgi:hypothetical protein